MAKSSLEWSVPKVLGLLMLSILIAMVLFPGVYFISLNIFDHEISFVPLTLLCAPFFTPPFIYLKLGADAAFDDQAYIQTMGLTTVLKHVLTGVAVSAIVAALSLRLKPLAPGILVALFGMVFSIVAGVFTVAYLARGYFDKGVHPFWGILHRPK